MGSQKQFVCVSGHFRHGGDKQPTEPGDPRTSLFLTSETAVSCNIIESNQPITDESKSESERGQFEIPLDRTNLFLAPT